MIKTKPLISGFVLDDQQIGPEQQYQDGDDPLNYLSFPDAFFIDEWEKYCEYDADKEHEERLDPVYKVYKDHRTKRVA